jgi:ABC-type amino acid transport system permease subunit
MSQELSEVFYTFLITSVIGLLLGVGRICYKSKCSSIDLCCIKVVRNIDAEVKEDLELGDVEKK